MTHYCPGTRCEDLANDCLRDLSRGEIESFEADGASAFADEVCAFAFAIRNDAAANKINEGDAPGHQTRNTTAALAAATVSAQPATVGVPYQRTIGQCPRHVRLMRPGQCF